MEGINKVPYTQYERGRLVYDPLKLKKKIVISLNTKKVKK